MTDATASSLTLQDFEPLLPAEAALLRAAASGGIARASYQRPRGPTSELRLRAGFLALLARGGAPVAGRRLQLLGASIVGTLDLRGCRVPTSLWFYRCAFGSAPRLDGAHVQGSLTFADCVLPGLQAEDCRIDGELEINAGCSLYGEIQISRARIGRDLDCERLRLRESTKFPDARPCRIAADDVRVGGDVRLDGGAQVMGGLRFRGARIAGELRAGAAHVSAALDAAGTRGVALDLDDARVRGDVLLDAGFTAAGQVRLRRARIGGDLDCTGAAFDAVGDAGWSGAGAVLMDRARIGGALVLRKLQSPLQHASFIDARAGSLRDDAATWGQHYALDGFVYKRLAPDAPTDAGMRVAWLDRQFANPVADAPMPDPWRRLIKVLRRMGRDRSAGDVAIGRERHLRRAGLIGRDAPRPLRWLARLGHDLYGVFAGYGHRPARTVLAALALWLACAAVYWAAARHGAFALAAPAGQPAASAPSPLAYSLDVLLPLLDLGHARNWVPAGDPLALGAAPLLRALNWFEALCGWLAAAALVVSLTGLADRDRRA